MAVAKHEIFQEHLTGWTSEMLLDELRNRLSGLISQHPNGTFSAHPLVRGHFRRLAFGAARLAAETALMGVPNRSVTSQNDAGKVTEVIELLLDAGQWEAANDLYRARTQDSRAWMRLPAARLGQRAATAFVAPVSRRKPCAKMLGVNRLGFYLNEAGLLATVSGDLTTGARYLHEAVEHGRNTRGVPVPLSSLQNICDCMGYAGDLKSAKRVALEAITSAEKVRNLDRVRDCRAMLGWIAGQGGDTRLAEEQFMLADSAYFLSDRNHLFSSLGVRWAEWLLRTGRRRSAQSLTASNYELCANLGWNADKARCDRVQGIIALEEGDLDASNAHLVSAAECFREGDYLCELCLTLIEQAKCARASGLLDAAAEHCTEAMNIAGPRDMTPVQAASLAILAQVYIEQAASAASTAPLLARARDAAAAGLRVATRRGLAWCELEAICAHGALDRAEGIDHGWTEKAGVLHSQLVPQDLDPDPLATVQLQFQREGGGLGAG